MDFETAGLLDGLSGDDRAARLRLLEHLADQGFSLEEMRNAAEEERLALLPVERVLGGPYTSGEMAKRAGIPPELVTRIRRLQGLPEPGPDERVFGEVDLDGLKATKQFLDSGFDQEAIDQITRVLGEAMARLAATVTAAFADTFLEAGDNEEEVALRFAALAEELTPRLTPVLVATFQAHLREAVRRGMLGRAELEAGHLQGEQDLAVCFADLVGFTRLGGQIEVEELGTVAGRLAELAADLAGQPVRLVKTIGDAAMFVSRDVAALVEVALSLVEAVQEADMPALRAGIARGPAVPRAGDFYGHSVNLASRVTGVARAGSVLCTEAVRDAAPEQFDWSFAGKHRLKGVKEPVSLFRARRAQSQAPTTRKADRPRKRASR
jgi:adenylate cyclase